MSVNKEVSKDDTGKVVASPKLMKLIESWVSAYVTSSELVEQILKQAQSEQVPKEELRSLVETALKKRGLKDRQIRSVLPSELKRTYTKSAAAAKVIESLESDQKTIEIIEKLGPANVNEPIAAKSTEQDVKVTKRLEKVKNPHEDNSSSESPENLPIVKKLRCELDYERQHSLELTEVISKLEGGLKSASEIVKSTTTAKMNLDRFFGEFFAANRNARVKEQMSNNKVKVDPVFILTIRDGEVVHVQLEE